MRGVFLCAPFHSIANPPVGLAYLRARLARDGIEASIRDLNIESRNWLADSEDAGPALVEELFQQSRRSYLGEALTWSWLDPGGTEAVQKRAREHPEVCVREFWRDAGIDRLESDAALLALGERLRSWLGDAVESLAGAEIGWAGVSLTVGNLAASFWLAGMLRRLRPDLLILAGGPHVSGRNADDLLRACEALDVAVPAPAYETLAALLARPGAAVPGAITRERPTMSRGARPHPPFDELPFADWSQIDLSRYAPSFDISRAWGAERSDTRTMPLQTSRGCSYARCEFCHNVVDYPRLLMQTPPRVVAELEHQHEREGVSSFFFTDDEFNSSRKRIREIGERLAAAEPDLRFMAWMRIDKIDRETLEILYEGGCRHVFFGVEAVDDALLDAMRKGYGAETALEGLRMLASFAEEAGDFDYSFNLIIDHPLERVESVSHTLRAIGEEPELFVGRVGALCRFHIYEGTPAAARYGSDAIGCLEPIVPPGTPVDSFRYLMPCVDDDSRASRMELWSAVEWVTSLGRRSRSGIVPAGIGIYD